MVVVGKMVSGGLEVVPGSVVVGAATLAVSVGEVVMTLVGLTVDGGDNVAGDVVAVAVPFVGNAVSEDRPLVAEVPV